MLVDRGRREIEKCGLIKMHKVGQVGTDPMLQAPDEESAYGVVAVGSCAGRPDAT